jgi:hypothetical protein
MKKTLRAYRRLWASAPSMSSGGDSHSSSSSQVHTSTCAASRRFSQGDAEDAEICIRGLEHLASQEVLRSRVEEQSTLLQAVLSLQRENRSTSNPSAGMNALRPELGIEHICPDDTCRTIRNMLLELRCSALSRDARRRALQAAKTDQAEAKRVQQSYM